MENEVFQPVVELLQKLRTKVPAVSYPRHKGQVCIIDMGHGGLVDGKYTTAPNKMYKHADDFIFYEGVFNRAVGYTLAYELKEAGRNYVLLNTGDNDLSLTNRVKAIKAWGQSIERGIGGVVYVRSIHGNAAGVKEANGIEVFTSPGQDRSDPIATVDYNELYSMGWKMRPAFNDGDPDKEERFTILTGHSYPAVLDELGFYTNEAEARKMCDPTYIYSLAACLFRADIRIDQLNLLR